jgi:hypothetical protein
VSQAPLIPLHSAPGTSWGLARTAQLSQRVHISKGSSSHWHSGKYVIEFVPYHLSRKFLWDFGPYGKIQCVHW